MTQPPLPDVARLVAAYLRTAPTVTAIAGDRVYTAFPAQLDPGEPFVLVQRFGGTPPLARPLVLDDAAIQLDAYGGRQATAHDLVRACAAELAELQGEQAGGAGNVCDVRPGPIRYQPDETYAPPRPRYVADFELTVKTPATSLAGRTTPAAVTAGATA